MVPFKLSQNYKKYVYYVKAFDEDSARSRYPPISDCLTIAVDKDYVVTGIKKDAECFFFFLFVHFYCIHTFYS